MAEPVSPQKPARVTTRRIQAVSKWFFLFAAIALAWPVRWNPVLLASFSPFISLGSVIASRAATVMALLAVPLFLVCFFVPRFFCRYACPVGFLQELCEHLRPPLTKPPVRLPMIGRWLAVAALASAAFGYPVFLWLDPLAIFSGFMNAWRLPITLASALPATGLIGVLIFDLTFPGIWCGRICPLGAFQDLLAQPRNWKRRAREPAGGRRAFIAACAGAAGAVIAQKVQGKSPAPLRPPGAIDELKFGGVCIRCGNCTQVCPSKIIRPDIGAHGITNFFTPVLNFDNGYCRENCHRCTEVCPSGALTPLSQPDKNLRVIGVASVNLDTCLLANGRECTACIQRCPFKALSIQSLDNGFTMQPVLDKTKCTGCGACEMVCPVRPERAIRVSVPPGNTRQAILELEEEPDGL